MEITLATTEDINQTLSREEELKQGNIPNKFTSYFVLNEIIPIGNKSRTRAKSERKDLYSFDVNKQKKIEKFEKLSDNEIKMKMNSDDTPPELRRILFNILLKRIRKK